MTSPPEPHAAPNQDHDEDFEFPLALGVTAVFLAFCVMAVVQTKQDHTALVHIGWVMFAGVTGVGAFAALIFTFLASDWYSKPLPRTDPDEPPDELRHPFSDTDHRSW